MPVTVRLSCFKRNNPIDMIGLIQKIYLLVGNIYIEIKHKATVIIFDIKFVLNITASQVVKF